MLQQLSGYNPTLSFLFVDDGVGTTPILSGAVNVVLWMMLIVR